MSKSALVVEDDPDLQRLIEAVLRGHCAPIEMAADGIEAIDRLQREQYDVVVLDIMLPRANGFEVAEVIRNLPNPPRIIVLSALTCYFEDRFPTGTVALQKPFDLRKLAHTVDAS